MIAFVVPVILYPILSRIFSVEDYAVFGLYVAVFVFLEVASAARYDFAVIIPEKDNDAIHLVAGGVLISLCYSMLVLVLVFLFGEFVVTRLNNSRLFNWLFFLPIALFLISISKLCNSWLIRKKKFKSTSLNRASQKLGEGATQLILGSISTSSGLILGDLFGKIFNACLSTFQAAKAGLKAETLSLKAIGYVLKKYIQFPKYGLIPTMLNALAGMLPVFIVSSSFSTQVSGNFNFSRIVLSIPFALIASGISQVLMQQVSERRHKNLSFAADVFSLASKLSVLSVIGIFILYFWGAELFVLVFGNQWRSSGQYTSVLIFSYAVSFIVSPFSVLLISLEKIKWAGYWQIFYFAAISVLWFFTGAQIVNFLIALVVIDIISYGLYGFIIYQAVWDYEHNLSRK
jgi:O-antigen/teichoic acid export membrane protein